MGLYKRFINQTRKPEGVLGKMMINGMNSGHSKMADWGMSFLPQDCPSEIAELGCGGGRNVAALLKRYPDSKVTAVDYSPLAIQKTLDYNKTAVASGRCIAVQGDVSALNLDKNRYDFATAFETVYFWPGLEKCFSQVAKILKAGGTFMIVNESDGADKNSLKYEKIIDGMKVYTAEKIKNALESAGFSSVDVHHHKSKPWITLVAKKG